MRRSQCCVNGLWGREVVLPHSKVHLVFLCADSVLRFLEAEMHLAWEADSLECFGVLRLLFF